MYSNHLASTHNFFAGIKYSNTNRIFSWNRHEVYRAIMTVLITLMIIGLKLFNQWKY